MSSFVTSVARWLGRGMLIGMLALLWPVAVAQAQAQAQPRVEAGTVEAKLERNYARIVFSFAQRPRHTINAQAGVLVVRFERPVDVHVEELRRTLAAVVASVRKDADGQGIRFALTRRLRVNTAEAAEQLFVDLLPEPWNGPPPPLPPEVVAEIERRAAEQERERREEAERMRRRADVQPVEVVTSEAATFSRVELRWRDRAEPAIQRSGRQVRLVFDKIGTMDLGPVRARLPRFIEDIQAVEEDARTVVILTVDPVRDVRSFTEGNAFFIDVQGPERGRGLEFRADGSTLGEPDPQSVTAPSTVVRGAADDRVAVPRQGEASADPPPAQAQTQSQAPSAQPPEAGAAPASVPRSARPPAFAPDGRRIVAVDAFLAGGAAELRLLFAAPTPAGIFVRGRTLTMLFETPQLTDPSDIREQLPRMVRSVTRERAGPGAEIIRVELEEPLLVAAQAEGLQWTIRLGDAGPTVRAIDVRPRTLADGRTILSLNVPGAAQPVRMSDRIVGDMLTIIPALGPQIGLVKPQRFVEVDLLQSAQGAVVRDQVDDLVVRKDGDTVIIERDAGLSLSGGGLVRASAVTAIAPPDIRAGFIDFEGWKLGPVDRFAAIRDNLVARAAAIEKPAERTGPRLELARFLLSHALGHEAGAVLSLAGRDDPIAERDLSFRVLRGVANVLAERPDDAERDLQGADVDDNPDVGLWRGLAHAQRRDWARARRFLERSQPVLIQYPLPLQARAVRSMAEAAIELGDVGRADAMLDEAAGLDPNPRNAARIALLRGRLAEMTGRLDAALDHYGTAARATHPGLAADATVRRIALSARMDRMGRDAAIASLDSLSLGWRGDHVEIEAYRLLANLNVGRGDYRAAFAAASAAVVAKPGDDTTRTIQDDVRNAFADLYLSGLADRQPPLEALALFYDYRDFVPPGRRGDEMIRNLAERLVQVDLLDQAAELLAHQVDNRLQGAARADVGARLAFIHLMNREPDKALQVIRRTRIGTLPRDLERRRLIVEARALAASDRPEVALELLGNDQSEETLRLRSDILWDGRRWQDAAVASERVLGDVWRRTSPLTDKARGDVLRAAVGYSLAGDQPAIDRLRTRYSNLMADTPEAVSFAVLTGRIEARSQEFRNVVRELAATDTLSRFIQEYRERFSPETTSGAPQATLPGQPPA